MKRLTYHRFLSALLCTLQFAACAHAEKHDPVVPSGKPDTRAEETAAPEVSPRRAVPAMTVERSPFVATPPVPMPSPSQPPPSVQRPVPPSSPAPVTTCDTGGCWNPGGTRYQGGAGSTYLDNSGKLCQRNGTWMQCY